MGSTVQTGWKAIFRTGIWILKENESELLEMNFEHILNFITEKPKQMLSCQTEEETRELEQNNRIYYRLRDLHKDMLDQKYMLNRLEREFKESLDAASNKSSPAKMSP